MGWSVFTVHLITKRKKRIDSMRLTFAMKSMAIHTDRSIDKDHIVPLADP